MKRACGICGSEESSLWLSSARWHYLACLSCSVVWLEPLPSLEWSEKFYDQGYFAGGGRGGYQDYLSDEEQHRINARARIAFARRFGASAPGVWLDVGCAAGFTLDEARKAGFLPLGVELSSWARIGASDRFGLQIFKTLAEARKTLLGKADVVSFFQVIEHMPDPVAALEDARACLRPGGLVIIETWDRGSKLARLLGRFWQQISPPSVLWLFDRSSLHKTLDRAAFRDIQIFSTSKRISFGCALGILADKEPRFLGPVLRALGRTVLRKVAITYRFGDLVSVVAQSENRGTGS